MNKSAETQRRLILDQFTRQAEPFAKLAAHSHEESIRFLIEAAGIGPEDNVLDVACGPGLLARAFARVARHVTGIDLTPAMIEQARALQRAEGLENLSWNIGDVSALPFADGSFSVAFTRFSFHHLLDPAAVLAEMVRVTRPGGRVAVVDVYTTSPEQGQAYDQVERLRDPSHVRALGLEEFTELAGAAGLRNVATSRHGLGMDLEELLGSSFPEPGAADQVRRLLAEDIGRNRTGFDARQEDGAIQITFPVLVLVGRKPA